MEAPFCFHVKYVEMVFQQGLCLQTLFLYVLYEHYYFFMRDFILFPFNFTNNSFHVGGQRTEIVHRSDIEIVDIMFEKKDYCP